MSKDTIHVSKKVLDKIQRKVNRNFEIEEGNRQNYNRVHQSKVAYKRQKNKRILDADFF